MDLSLRQSIGKKLEATIYEINTISGGDISNAYLLKTSKGDFFIKVNNALVSSEMFRSEMIGLKTLAATQTIRIPEVTFIGSEGTHTFLCLEYIEQGEKSDLFWEQFGQSLASLHRIQGSRFGLNHSNFIGRLPQQNNFHDNWVDFYINERLSPQIELAKEQQLIDFGSIKNIEHLYKKLDSICPKEMPSLIHGDLWNGNFLSDKNSQAVLIDPSVSYAHREMDIAMTYLFGGFSPIFYDTYNNIFPLEPGIDSRLEVYQLYYLLVHLNMFGKAYLGSVQRIIQQYK